MVVIHKIIFIDTFCFIKNTISETCKWFFNYIFFSYILP